MKIHFCVLFFMLFRKIFQSFAVSLRHPISVALVRPMSEAWSCKDGPRHGVVRTQEHQTARKILYANFNGLCKFRLNAVKRRISTRRAQAWLLAGVKNFCKPCIIKPFKMKSLYSFSNFQEALQQTCTSMVFVCSRLSSLSIIICKSQRCLDNCREFKIKFAVSRVA